MLLSFVARAMGSRRAKPSHFNPYPQPQRSPRRGGIRYVFNGMQVTKETFKVAMEKAHAGR